MQNQNRKKVMIVDDESDLREIVGETLSEDFRIVYARGGNEAIALFEEQKPDAIVLDLRMPAMDGFEVCEKIRTNPLGASVPILVVSGSIDPAAKDRAIKSGADEYMQKPFNPSDLLLRVRTHVRVSVLEPKNLEFKGLRFQTATRTVNANQQILVLREIEARVLENLLEAKGEVVSRAALATSIWQGEDKTEGRKLDPHISSLRKKLQDLGYSVKMIYGLGYLIESYSA